MSHKREHFPEPHPVQPNSHVNITQLDGYAAQALFESMFPPDVDDYGKAHKHIPKIDVRTPADVARQHAVEHWH